MAYKLSVGDPAIGIAVIPEHVLNHIVQLIWILVQDLHQSGPDLLLLKKMVLVDIELREDLIHPLADKLSESVIREGEFIDPSGAEWP